MSYITSTQRFDMHAMDLFRGLGARVLNSSYYHHLELELYIVWKAIW